MRTNDAVERPDVTAPVFCPFCRSKDLKTAAKIINESTYWRCIACGEIWNPAGCGQRRRRILRRRW